MDKEIWYIFTIELYSAVWKVKLCNLCGNTSIFLESITLSNLASVSPLCMYMYVYIYDI